jgi:hypothetical protein
MWASRDGFWATAANQDIGGPLESLLGDLGQLMAWLPLRETPVQRLPHRARDYSPYTWQPDTMVGWPERVRVGDTPLGRMKVYADPFMVHMVIPTGG